MSGSVCGRHEWVLESLIMCNLLPPSTAAAANTNTYACKLIQAVAVVTTYMCLHVCACVFAGAAVEGRKSGHGGAPPCEEASLPA